MVSDLVLKQQTIKSLVKVLKTDILWVHTFVVTFMGQHNGPASSLQVSLVGVTRPTEFILETILDLLVLVFLHIFVMFRVCRIILTKKYSRGSSGVEQFAFGYKKF